MLVLDLLKPWYAFRDAATGRYVSRLYAALHPTTTVSERCTRHTPPPQPLPPEPPLAP